MPPTNEDTILEETAYHEAGHAILALALGVDVPDLSIVPDREWLGACDIDYEARFAVPLPGPGNFIDVSKTHLRVLCFFAAGRLAQRKFLMSRELPVDEEKLDNGAREDYEGVARKLASLKEAGCDAELEHILPQIDDYFRREDVWPMVEALATRLLGAYEIQEISAADYRLPPFILIAE